MLCTESPQKQLLIGALRPSGVLCCCSVSQATEKSVRSAASAEEEQVGIIAKLDSQIAAECAKHVAILARHAEQEEKELKARNTLTEV